MDIFDKLRHGQVQLVVATVQRDAFGIQHRPHGPVADQGPFIDSLEKRFAHPLTSLAYPPAGAGRCKISTTVHIIAFACEREAVQ